MSTFAKPVKPTINFLKTSKLGGTWKLMDPEHQSKTTTTTTRHWEYWRTLGGKHDYPDDTKQEFSGSPLKNCQTIASTPKTSDSSKMNLKKHDDLAKLFREENQKDLEKDYNEKNQLRTGRRQHQVVSTTLWNSKPGKTGKDSPHRQRRRCLQWNEPRRSSTWT